LGRAFWAKGDVEQARGQFQEAIQLRPDFLGPRLSLALIHLNKSEWEAAYQGASEALSMYPDNVDAGLVRASALMGMGRPEEGRLAMETLVKRNPDNKEVVLHLARSAFALKRYDEAEKAFSKCRDDSGCGLRCTLGLAEVYAARGQFDRAFRMLTEGESKHQGHPELRLVLANLSVQAGKYDVAISIYRELIAGSPQSSDLHIRLGEAYRRKGELDPAIECFRKGRDLNANDPAAHHPLALLLDQAGRRAEARAAYEQVLKLQPDSAIALNNLAYLIAEQGGDIDLALTYAQRAKQKYPKSPDISDTLGWIYIKKNLSGQAIGILKEIVIQYPGNSTYRYHLAMALFQKGDRLAAKKELETALRNRPDEGEQSKIRDLMARIG
jgi:tetratricopeptide (TPR) repeat protein